MQNIEDDVYKYKLLKYKVKYFRLKKNGINTQAGGGMPQVGGAADGAVTAAVDAAIKAATDANTAFGATKLTAKDISQDAAIGHLNDVNKQISETKTKVKNMLDALTDYINGGGNADLDGGMTKDTATGHVDDAKGKNTIAGMKTEIDKIKAKGDLQDTLNAIATVFANNKVIAVYDNTYEHLATIERKLNNGYEAEYTMLHHDKLGFVKFKGDTVTVKADGTVNISVDDGTGTIIKDKDANEFKPLNLNAELQHHTNSNKLGRTLAALPGYEETRNMQI